ncbi:MAG TPA: alpha/beta hydrolase, partial [Terriglobales bacterium]|nr:alpha/beta hydrolase [Terriglobales bacterium]
LRSWLRKDKIILLGHSWGSVLGVLMARKKPQLFQAYIGTGQVGHVTGGYDVAFTALLARARAGGDVRAVRELQEIGPPPYKDGDGYQVQRRWANFFEGADAFIASMFGFALAAPGYTLHDINDWSDGMVLSAEKLIQQENALAPTALEGRFALPVIVIQGEDDFTTPTSLARAFVERIEAPRKKFVTIKGGHFAVFMNSSEFMKEMGALLQ